MLEIFRAIRRVGPRTWIMVPFTNKTYKLLEVNLQFWMLVGLTLAIRSGVDVPGIILSLMNGNNTTPVISYQTGLRYRWVLPSEVLLVSSNNLEVLRSLTIVQFSKRACLLWCIKKTIRWRHWMWLLRASRSWPIQKSENLSLVGPSKNVGSKPFIGRVLTIFMRINEY